uniref:Anthocyanin acyltransferase n=2 Tax=Kalanchoe fedtschenkoi TaxID=63787 RepID=A0A7N0TB93_KALFE
MSAVFNASSFSYLFLPYTKQRSTSVLARMSSHQVKVLEQCQISPPPDSVPTTSLPFTFLDVTWMFCCPIQRIFLYQVPFSAAQFTDQVLPRLKKSLSLALQRFFPFCGNFVCPPQPSEPHILYNDGDSVQFLVAQSTGALSEFLSDGLRDSKEIHTLVPPTPPTRILDDTLVELTPLLSVQVTLFPNSGLCIGIKYRHTVADGMSSIHFVKTWASIFQANCDMSCVCISLPVIDRGVIEDPKGNKDAMLGFWRAWGSPTWKEDAAALMEDNVRATFTLSRYEIERMKKWVSAKCDNGPLHLSSFVVTTAFIWVCLIKSLDVVTNNASKDVAQCHFGLAVDCRNRFGLAIPDTFFGNCIAGRIVSFPRGKFKEDDCVAPVAAAIGHSVQSLDSGVVDGYRNSFSKWPELHESGDDILTVAGSPKLAQYDTNFGWGKPRKVEVVHIDISGSISLSESRNGDGGLEVGVARNRRQMEVFTSFFQQGLNQFV